MSWASALEESGPQKARCKVARRTGRQALDLGSFMETAGRLEEL
jgi:hypothetical protein